MAERVRLSGGNIGGIDNEGIDAQVSKNGSLHVVFGDANGLNQSYEDTSFVTGDSPRVIDFETDAGRISKAGWMINDGDGDIKVEISLDGLVYGGQFTMKLGEAIDFAGIGVSKLRLVWVSNSAYRIFLI